MVVFIQISECFTLKALLMLVAHKIWQNCITISQSLKNGKVEKCYGEKTSKVEINKVVQIVLFYYSFHIISILQVKKLVVQGTSDEK